MTRAAVAVLATVVLGGCASVRGSLPLWMPGAVTLPEGAGDTFYAPSGGLVIRRRPSASAEVVTRLPPHARLTRHQVEGSWAFVTVGETSGWVTANALVRHLSTPAAPPPPPEPAPAGTH